jgi:sugar/nucleoside kinase (ribokinase family)
MNRTIELPSVVSGNFVTTLKEISLRGGDKKDVLTPHLDIINGPKRRLTDAILRRLGALTWERARLVQCPGFRVGAADTTGAGDIFHGGFLYGLAADRGLKEILEFGCAVASLGEIDNLRWIGERPESAYISEVLLEASRRAESKARP